MGCTLSRVGLTIVEFERRGLDFSFLFQQDFYLGFGLIEGDFELKNVAVELLGPIKIGCDQNRGGGVRGS